MKKKIFLGFAVWAFSTAVVFAAGGAAGQGAQADNYPNKPIRIILGVAPGGAMETAARLWQPFLEKELGQPVVIDCIPGAEGMIGGRVAKEAPADGYTFIQMPITFLAAHAYVLGAPYKFEDFEIISNYVTDPEIFIVHKDSPWKTMKEFLDYMKTQPPRTQSFGMTAYTGVSIIIFDEIEKHEGVQFNLVSFNGGNPARLALAGKHITGMITPLFGSQSIWEYVRVLAISHEKNLWGEFTNNAPTFNDALGYSTPIDADNISIFAPAGFSTQYPERYKKFVNAFLTAIQSPGYKEAIAKLGQTSRIFARTPEESKKIMEECAAVYRENIDVYKAILGK